MSGIEFSLSEDLTFTTNCYYRTDFDMLSANKISKNKQNQDFTFTLTLKVNGEVEFVGPKGVIQAGRWIRSINSIAILLEEDPQIDSTIAVFELSILEHKYATYQADIEANSISRFIYGTEDLFVVAWTDESRTSMDELVG